MTCPGNLFQDHCKCESQDMLDMRKSCAGGVRQMLLKLIGFMAVLVAAPLAGQEVPQSISPLQIDPDRNGVNLVTGKITAEPIVLSVPAAPRLRFDRIQNSAPYVVGTVTKSEELFDSTGVWTVHTIDGVSELFRCAWDIDDGKICASERGTGSALSYSGALFRKAGSGEKYTLNVIHVFTAPAPSNPDQRLQRLFYASQIEFPDGEVLTYSYDTAQLSNDPYARNFYRPSLISTNRGYQMAITYQGQDLSLPGWGTPAQVTITKTGSPNTPLARLTFGSNGTATDLAGRVFQGVSPGTMSVPIEVANLSQTLPGESSPELVVTEKTGLPSSADMVGIVNRDGVAWNYSYTNPTANYYLDGYDYDALTVTGPNGYSRLYSITTVGSILAKGIQNLVTQSKDELNRTTNYQYDAFYRLRTLTAPEGNSVTIDYDMAGNLITKTSGPKPGSGLASLVEQLNIDLTPYLTPTGSFVDCRLTVMCWRPSWYRDALGRQTDYSYNSLGQMTQELAPADANGLRRQTNVTYTTSASGVSRKTLVRVCGGASCTGNAESRTEYTYWGETDLPLTIAQKDEATGETRTTTFTYDDAGRVLSVDGPLPGPDDAQYSRYDVLGRKTWEIGEAAANGTRLAKKFTYRDADDKVTNVQLGQLDSPTDTTLAIDQQTDLTYDSRRNPIRERTYQGSTVYRVTDKSFLDRGLPECSTVRVNLANLPAATASGACSLGTTGTHGSDRITRNVYDTAGQLTKVQKAYATALQQDYVTYTYTGNGKQQYVTDANGNRAQFAYDGFDRLSHWYFPSKTTAGTVNTSDYEQYGYDAAGNRTSLRKRDGLTLTYEFDALNRMTLKTVPSRAGLTAAQVRDVFYSYDLMGRQLTARFDSQSGADRVQNTYNAFGEMLSSTTAMGTFSKGVSSIYDPGGRRTRLNTPDSQSFTYAYDARDRLTNIYYGSVTTSPLIAFTYNGDGTLASRSEGNGVSGASYAWDDIGRLTSQSDVIGGTGANVSWGFTLNPASQIVTSTRTETNNAYAYTGLAATSRAYTVNGLNQYSAVAGNSYTYDANGNLTSDGINTYTYDVENRLVKAVAGGVTTNIVYDALGRLAQTDKGTAATTTKFLYDGDALVLENNSSNTSILRYVHGSNAAADDPLVFYTGTSMGYLHADHQGSIVGVTLGDGTSYAQNAYDEYGVPKSGNVGRFQYTGQAWIPELGMYYYKARFYSAMLGRFMQTDPIGYDDQINLYAYVGNDPVNNVDPSGEKCATPQNGPISCRVDDRGKGTDRQIAKIERQYTKAVEKLLANRDRKVSIGAETGSRIAVSTKVTQGEIADALIGAHVSYKDSQPMVDGVAQTDLRASVQGSVDQGDNSVRITIYPHGVNDAPGNRLGQTFIHEGGHATAPGARIDNLYRRIFGNFHFERDHQAPYRRMTRTIWPDER